MNPAIFREYDIRGKVGPDLHGESVERIGRAAGEFFAARGVRVAAIGRDVRLSSAEFAERLGRGLRAAGLDTIDLGVVSTPLLYWAVIRLGAGAGFMVTGSHNPVSDNGIKICAAGALPLTADEIQDVRRRTERAPAAAVRPGAERRQDLRDAYLSDLASRFSFERRFRVGVDAGNGVAGPLVLDLFARLGVEVLPLYCEPDGSFPNHLPDPEQPENCRDLMRLVVEKKLDLGLGFDGDADRVGVVDETGAKLPADWLLALFSREMLRANPGGGVRFDVKCTDFLERDVLAHGGRPVMGRTGHSILKSDMAADPSIVLGGELSGHIVFGRGYHRIDDSFYSALVLLRIMAEDGRPLSARFAGFPRTVFTPEIKVPCPEERKKAVVAAVDRALSGKHDVVRIDGVRVKFDDGWGLVRASNTTPVLTLRFEASGETALARNRAEVEAALLAAGCAVTEVRH